MNCYERLSKNLKQLRSATHKTQEQIAAEVNIARSSIARYETGENIPPLDVILVLADYYDVTLDDLLREEL